MNQDFEDSFIDFDNDGCCGNPLRGCDPCPPVKTQVLQKPKLTFERWANSTPFPLGLEMSHAQWVWQAAQENCR